MPGQEQSIKNKQHPIGTEFIELPRTPTRRGAMASATVLTQVSLNPNVIAMLAWRGRHYRPGQRISEQELCSISKIPVVVELTETAEDEGHRRCWRLLKVLWRYDRDRKCFVELARFLPPASYEDMEMRKMAARAMKQDLWRELESVEESAERIERYLSTELYQLGNRRRPVLEVRAAPVARPVDRGERIGGSGVAVSGGFASGYVIINQN